jgi:phosphoribosylamine-glycine ligase
MNIGVLSSVSSYHHLAQLFTNTPGVDNVFHFGANKALSETDIYHPRPIEVPMEELTDHMSNKISSLLKTEKIDFLLASGVPVAYSSVIHNSLKESNIPYFFPSKELVRLEVNKNVTKAMLNKIGIPNSPGEIYDGRQLFAKFKSLPRPFVVKLNYVYQYGRQTYIVNDENYEEVFLDLFSDRAGLVPRITNINNDTNITVEKFVNLKREYSYHLVANATGWQYLGSARDYKKLDDGDVGFNSVSMGAYNVDDIDPRVHEYADKIINYLKNYGYPYKGFMFIGIGIDEDDVPIVLEINTRSGDPELQVILGSIENNLADLFLACSTDARIPDIVHNNKKSVTVRLVNTHYDWKWPASFLPKLNPCPDNIICGLEGTERFYIKHSVVTTSDTTHEQASKTLYDYLDKQQVGQYRYRRDIGLLK